METKSENLTRGKKINPNVGPENPVPSVPPGGNHSYNDPTPEEIPIICMGGFDTDEEDSIIKTQSEEKMIEFMKEELNEIRECGFNCFIRLVFSDASDFNHVMDLLSIKDDLTAIANFRIRYKKMVNW